MQKRKFVISFGTVLLLTILTVQPAVATDLTWHSSVVEGTSWTWVVIEHSGDIATFFGSSFDVLEEGVIIEVSAVGNPPTVGDWVSMFSSGSIAWADLYVNGTQIPGNEEAVIYFFIAPLYIDNTTEGWDAWVFAISFITAFMGSNYESSNSTSGNLISYLCSNSGGSGNSLWSVAHELVYDNSTGFLNSYIYNYSNTTLASSLRISRSGSGGILDDLNIPGFGLGVTILSLGALLLLPVIYHRYKK